MFQAFDDTWRWRFRAGDRFFGRFWVQTIRFMARSKLVGNRQAEIQTDRRRYQRGQPIQLRVRFPNPGLAPAGSEVTVQIERQGQGPQETRAQAPAGSRNVFEGALAQAAEGEYRVRLLPPPVLERPVPRLSSASIAPISEREHIQMNQPELVRAAEVSGGKFYTPLNADALVKDLPAPSLVLARHRPADPALEHLARPDAVPDPDHDGMGSPQTQADGIIEFARFRRGFFTAAKSHRCTMTVLTFRDLLRERPFQPFRLVMSGGQSYEVHHPEMAFLTQTSLVVGVDETDEGVPAEFKICSLLHVTAVEPLNLSESGPVGIK